MLNADRPTLNAVLDAHEEWIASGGSAGARGELAMAIARGADFRRRQLQRAEFQDCDFTDADFADAQLETAVFRRCSLTGALFSRAQLAGAQFIDCTGLMTRQFAGADLSGVSLPASAQNFPPLQRIPEIAKRAYVLVSIIVSGTVALWLALASITDIALLTNTGELQLPGMELSLPSATFVIVAPAILLSLWTFLVFTLQHLWEELATLPRVFIDGEERGQKLDIWLFGQYASRHLETRRRGRDWVRPFVFRLLVWFLVPFTTFLCWAFYVRRHHVEGNRILVLMTAAAVGLTLHHSARARAALRESSLSRAQLIATVSIVVVLVGILSLLGYAARRGVGDYELRSLNFLPVRGALATLEKLRIRRAVSVWETTLTAEQKNLRGADIQDIDAGKLKARGINLSAVHGVGANFSTADLTEANLASASLQFGSLSDAVLDRAKAQGVQLELAFLGDTRFRQADLAGASLIEVSARKADFTGADVSSAIFRGADLREAVFRDADVQFADFYAADLRGADFTGARNADRIRCISRANLANVVGLTIPRSVPGAQKIIQAEEDDDYRRKFVELGNDPWDPCGMPIILGWEIQGPPAVTSYGVSPRSLRSDTIELPKPLPRYLRRDIARLLDGLASLEATDARSAFETLRKELHYERDGDEFITSRPGSPFEANILQAWDMTCKDGSGGFTIRFTPRENARRIDIDEFVIAHLDKRGTELGTERRWNLKRGTFTSRQDRDLVFTTCESTR